MLEVRNDKEREEGCGERSCLKISQLLGMLRPVWISVGAG